MRKGILLGLLMVIILSYNSIAIGGSFQHENESITGSCLGSDIDTSQNLTYEKAWYKDGTYFSDEVFISSQDTTVDEEWILSCRVSDGVATSDSLNSTAVTITDTSTVPEVEYATFTGEAGSLVGHCKANDDEGDLLNYSFRWYRNDILNVTYSNDSITSNQEIVNTHTPPSDDAGNDWILSCQATDLDGSTGFLNSTEKTIPSIEFSNFRVEEATDTSIKVAWYTDYPSTDYVELYLNGTFITETTLYRYTFTGLEPNTTYPIKAIPVEAGFSGEEYTINGSTVPTDNPSPVMQEATITPANAYTDTALTGSCRADDVNNIRVFYTYEWRVNGSLVDEGVTGYEDRDTTKIVGSITTSNFEFNDTVKLTCIADDGTTSSEPMNKTITINNREPVVDNIFVQQNGSDFTCSYDYSDVDGDLEVTPSYEWYRNDNPLGADSQSIAQSTFSTGDDIICQVETGDEYSTDTYNSSTYTYGDIEKPTVTIEEIPTSVFSDSSNRLEVTCEDNTYVASGYPVIRFINPNYVEEEYPFFYDTGIDYYRYHTFGTVGEYTSVEIECRDGNGNRRVEEFDSTIYSKDRETTVVVGGGGGGGGATEEEIIANLSNYEVSPIEEVVNVGAGGSSFQEFEITNTGSTDLTFTLAIMRGEEDEETYDWMSFTDGSKTSSFDLQREGIGSDTRFVRYVIEVPDDVEPDTYDGVIQINGGDETVEYKVDIVVGEGVDLLGFFETELFRLPIGQEPTDEDVITGEFGGFFSTGRVTIGVLVIFLVGLTVVFLGGRWILRKI